MAEGAGGDQTVHTRANGDPRPACRSVKIDGAEEDIFANWRLDPRKRKYRLQGDPIGPLFIKALQDLLNDGQAGHDIVEIENLLDLEFSVPAEELNPD